ncbi:AzlD domain-containing protein [Candidatus Stoquefichus massiliensis]|uniref:AzlD domain-containing protein n=1 Tax=Candidatus Stoquefichus massiliensis TaxID=1470350 RepID=UPI000488CC20|nr:AzlD domain-containing protein [Candidatus Stoquefichus massiliensis]
MSKYILICVLIMAVFTYLPRMLPLTFFRKEITSPFIRSLLYYVPYAVLSALTFPSIFYATGNIYSAIGGCLVGIYFAYYDKGLIFVASAAMFTSLMIGLIS